MIHAIDYNHNTPLHLASFYGHFELVSFLLFKHANPISQNTLKMTPIHFAVYNKNYIETVLLCLYCIKNELSFDLPDECG